MRIDVLGTGAGESYPGLWCTCKNCSYARVHGGKNLRGNSSVLVDGRLMIDMPGSALQTAARLGISLASVETLLVTHAHSDHFSPGHLWERGYPVQFDRYAPEELENNLGAPCVTPLPLMHIYGTGFVGESIRERRLSEEEYHYKFHQIAGGAVFQNDGYRITALAANHVGEGYTVNYIIEKDGAVLLYASDTGGYHEDVWGQLLSHSYHGVLVEATHGLMPTADEAGHMNLDKCRRFLARLRENGCISEKTQVFLTHLSPHWAPPHDLLAPAMEKEGVGVAYDGMSFTLEP